MNRPGNEPNPVALLGKVLLVCSLSLNGELGEGLSVCPEAGGITRVGILLVCNLFLGAPRGAVLKFVCMSHAMGSLSPSGSKGHTSDV